MKNDKSLVRVLRLISKFNCHFDISLESSPTRRRSADQTAEMVTEKRARLNVTRRKSIAVIESGTSGKKVVVKSKTRLSLTLSGNGKATTGSQEARK